MNDHYYTENPHSAHDEREVTVEIFGKVLRFVTDAGVFSRDGLDRGTEVLLKALPPMSGRALDLGCGWGAVGVSLAAREPGLEVVMTDINARAVELARRNLAANGLRAEVVQGDGFESVQGKFDVIVSNPPIRAGKAAIYGMFDAARGFLKSGGAMYIVIRKQQGADSAKAYLTTLFENVETIARKKGFYIFCCSGPLPAGA